MRYKPTISQEEAALAAPEQETVENPFLTETSAPMDAPQMTPTEIDAVLAEPEVVVDEQPMLDIVQKYEDVDQAVTGLESIYLQLQSIGSGQISTEAMSFCSIAVDQALVKFPHLKSTDTPSLESIGDKIKKGIAALGELIKQFIEKVKQFAVAVFNSSASIKRKAEALQERMKKINPNGRPKTEITIPGLLNNPSLNGPNIHALGQMIDTFANTSFKPALDLFESIKLGKELSSDAELLLALQKAFDGYGRLQDKGPFIGNLTFKNDKFPPSINLLEAPTRTQPPLKIPTINDYLKQTVELTKHIAQLEKTSKERANALASLMTMLNTGANELNKEEGKEHSSLFAVIREGIRLLQQIQSFESRVLSRVLNTANAIIGICSQSIKALEAF